MICPPLFSKDVYAYMEQGWIVVRGANPYQMGLDILAGPFGGYVDSYWKYTTSVYPPLALWIQSLIVTFGGYNPIATMLMMRIPCLVSVLVASYSLSKAAHRVNNDYDLWTMLLNPISVIILIGGIHNDAWAMALASVAIALSTYRWGWILSSALVGAAMAIKQPLGVALIAVVAAAVLSQHYRVHPDRLSGHMSWTSFIRAGLPISVGSLIITLVTFALIHLPFGWGSGWAHATGSPYSTGSQSVTNGIVTVLRWTLGIPNWRGYALVSPVILAIGAALIGVIIVISVRRHPLATSGWALTIIALCWPSLQSWYLGWGLPMVAAYNYSPVGRRVVIAASSYFTIIAALMENATLPIFVAQLLSFIVCLAIWKYHDSFLKSAVMLSTKHSCEE